MPMISEPEPGALVTSVVVYTLVLLHYSASSGELTRIKVEISRREDPHVLAVGKVLVSSSIVHYIVVSIAYSNPESIFLCMSTARFHTIMTMVLGTMSSTHQASHTWLPPRWSHQSRRSSAPRSE